MGERPDRSGLPETTGAGQVCNDRSVSMKQNAADVHRYFFSSILRFHAGCGFFGSTGARLPRRKPWPSPVPRGGACAPPAARSSARGPPATTATTAHTTLTGAVPELKAEVRAPEPVHGDRQLQQLGPARAVVVVQHEGAVFAGRRLSGAQGDDVLRGNTQASRQGSSDSSGGGSAVCGLPGRHSAWNDPLRPRLPVPAPTAATGLRPFNSEAGLPGPPVPRVGLGDTGDMGTGEPADAATFSVGRSQKPLCLQNSLSPGVHAKHGP